MVVVSTAAPTQVNINPETARNLKIQEQGKVIGTSGNLVRIEATTYDGRRTEIQLETRDVTFRERNVEVEQSLERAQAEDQARINTQVQRNEIVHGEAGEGGQSLDQSFTPASSTDRGNVTLLTGETGYASPEVRQQPKKQDFVGLQSTSHQLINRENVPQTDAPQRLGVSRDEYTNIDREAQRNINRQSVAAELYAQPQFLARQAFSLDDPLFARSAFTGIGAAITGQDVTSNVGKIGMDLARKDVMTAEAEYKTPALNPSARLEIRPTSFTRGAIEGGIVGGSTAAFVFLPASAGLIGNIATGGVVVYSGARAIETVRNPTPENIGETAFIVGSAGVGAGSKLVAGGLKSLPRASSNAADRLGSGAGKFVIKREITPKIEGLSGGDVLVTQRSGKVFLEKPVYNVEVVEGISRSGFKFESRIPQEPFSAERVKVSTEPSRFTRSMTMQDLQTAQGDYIYRGGTREAGGMKIQERYLEGFDIRTTRTQSDVPVKVPEFVEFDVVRKTTLDQAWRLPDNTKVSEGILVEESFFPRPQSTDSFVRPQVSANTRPKTPLSDTFPAQPKKSFTPYEQPVDVSPVLDVPAQSFTFKPFPIKQSKSTLRIEIADTRVQQQPMEFVVDPSARPVYYPSGIDRDVYDTPQVSAPNTRQFTPTGRRKAISTVPAFGTANLGSFKYNQKFNTKLDIRTGSLQNTIPKSRQNNLQGSIQLPRQDTSLRQSTFSTPKLKSPTPFVPKTRTPKSPPFSFRLPDISSTTRSPKVGGKAKLGRGFRYTPQVYSIVTGLTSKKAPKTLTGLEVRPVITRSKRKKKKKGEFEWPNVNRIM